MLKVGHLKLIIPKEEETITFWSLEKSSSSPNAKRKRKGKGKRKKKLSPNLKNDMNLDMKIIKYKFPKDMEVYINL